MEKFVTITTNFMPVMREATLESKPHLVAPVTLLVEGVHNGVLYTANELAKYPSAWNGIPLPIDHPRVDGVGVTANEPTIIEEQCVGNLFNVMYDSEQARLIGEVWINIEKAQALSPAILSIVRSGRKLEISTGLYTDDDGTPGMWNGQQYAATVMNFRPDHLALLPGGVGACSIADGCGVNTNKEEPMKTKDKIKKRFGFMLNDMVEKMGFGLNEQSHGELRNELRNLVDALDSSSWMHFLSEVYDDYIIYEARSNNPSEGIVGVSKLYKRNYSKVDDVAVLADDVIEVREERNYVPVGNVADATSEPGKQQKETAIMQKNEAAVQALIACERTRFVEADAEWLTALSAEQLETMKAVEPCADPPDVKVKPDSDHKADPLVVNDDLPVTLESYISNAPPEVGGMLRRLVDRDVAEKDAVVAALVANSRCKFTKEQLDAKPLEELNVLAEMADVPVDFSASAGPAPVSNDDGPGPMPLVFERKTA